jgi:hypothetical protein
VAVSGVLALRQSRLSRSRGDAGICGATRMTDELEVWKKIPSCKGYAVSNLGRVRSLPRISENSGRKMKGKLMTPTVKTSKLGTPYVAVDVWAPLEKKVGVAELVLEAFRGPRPKPTACAGHRDGDPTNNRLSNLFWGTRTIVSRTVVSES